MTEPSASTQAGERAQTVACVSCGRRNRIRATASGVPRCAACGAALPWLTAADDRDFDAVVTDSALPVLIEVWASWCGPCRVVAPGIERAARTLAGRLKAVKVNVDEAPGVVARLEAQSIPTLVLLDHGQVRGRQVGALAPDALLQWVSDEIDRLPG